MHQSPSGLGDDQFEPLSEKPIEGQANLRRRALRDGSGGAQNNFDVCPSSYKDSLKGSAVAAGVAKQPLRGNLHTAYVIAKWTIKDSF